MIASKIGTIYELPSLIDDFRLTIYECKVVDLCFWSLDLKLKTK
jgi:hypothetical protein